MSREEESDETGRFNKISDEEVLMSPSPNCHIYKGFDRDEAVEVAWIEYTDTSPHVGEFEALKEQLFKMDHPHVMKYKQAWIDAEEKKVVFITEWITSGNLLQFQQKAKPPMKVHKKWSKQILLGLQYLHGLSPQFLHLDLRCENIYVRGNLGVVKIGGLESKMMRKKSNSASVMSISQQLAYLAPEVVDSQSMTERVDVYAFGILVLMMVSRLAASPYGELSPGTIYDMKIRGEAPVAVDRLDSLPARHFILRCLLPEKQRATVSDLLDDEFLIEAAPTQSALPIPSAVSRLPPPVHSVNTLSSAPPTVTTDSRLPATPPVPNAQASTPLLSQSFRGSPALSDTTIKAYFKPKDGGEVEAVRVDMDTIKSIEQLYTVLRDEFELEENVAFRIKYLDRDDEYVNVTPRTTLAQLRTYALSIHIVSAPRMPRFPSTQSASSHSSAAPMPNVSAIASYAAHTSPGVPLPHTVPSLPHHGAPFPAQPVMPAGVPVGAAAQASPPPHGSSLAQHASVLHSEVSP